jgi:group II intron reverse transcriptase/maturase
MPCANNPVEKVRELQRTLCRAAKRNGKRRFHALYDKIFRKDILRSAWEQVRAHKGAGGVDGQTIQSIEESGLDTFLLQLEEELREGCYKPQPVRRVYIPKADGKKRPLGIPVVRDRVVQCAMKIALEPIFEADFKPCSFGFRPKRSAHDAGEVVRQTANSGHNWVVDADIQDYFNTIDQGKLMRMVEKRVSDRRMLKLIRKFLKAGVFEDGAVRSLNTGTPQGGVLSPLLANIYLNYLDVLWSERCGKVGVLVRYADDLVILCRSEGNAREALRRLSLVMERLELKLHPDKTRIVGLWEGRDGFDFLGFHYHKVRSWIYKKYYLQRWPRAKAMKSIREKVRTIVGERRERLNKSLDQVINELNPVLRGWGNYFAAGNSAKCFTAIDSYVKEKLYLFLSKKHNVSGRGWATRWASIDFRKEGLYLLCGTVKWHSYSVHASG